MQVLSEMLYKDMIKTFTFLLFTTSTLTPTVCVPASVYVFKTTTTCAVSDADWVLQVSTYKVVTVNASRHGSDPCVAYPSSRDRVNGPIVDTIDEELHAPNEDFREELQTWMLLEVSLDMWHVISALQPNMQLPCSMI